MVYNGILMETIGISVMVSIGLLLFFLAGKCGTVGLSQLQRRQHQVTEAQVMPDELTSQRPIINQESYPLLQTNCFNVSVF